MFKFQDYPLKNNKVTANISQKNENFNNLTFKGKLIYEWRSRSGWLFLRDILEDFMFKFEDNPFKNNKVTAINSMNKQKLDF
jgi:hypothetical protein